MRVTFALLAAALLASAATGSGCSSSSDGGGASAGDASADAGCQPYAVPASFDPAAPVVSFRTDVVDRVFSKSCAFSSCHGGRNNNHGVYLTGDATEMRAGLVGAAAEEAPALQLVVAGDPGASFLMHKIDGDQCTLTASCAGGDCGTSMPQASVDTPGPLLSLELRDVVRRWIAQGAPDN